MLPIPERILLAITAGNAFCMASLIIALRRNGYTLPHLHRIWGVTAVALLPIIFMNQIADRLSIAAPWALVFVATVLASKCLRGEELMRMVKQVVTPSAAQQAGRPHRIPPTKRPRKKA